MNSPKETRTLDVIRIVRARVIRLIRGWASNPSLYTPARASSWNAPLVVIDGRSGSGKSTIAHHIATELRVAQIRGVQFTGPDLWFPGWNGLARGSDILEKLVASPSTTRSIRDQAGFYQWDWREDRWGSYQRLDRSHPLIVEGCGALTHKTAAAADLRIWVEAGAEERRERALGRDGNLFAPWWDTWAAQEDTHLRKHRPESLADITIHTGSHTREGA